MTTVQQLLALSKNHDYYSLSTVEKEGLYKAIFSRTDVFACIFLQGRIFQMMFLVRILNASHHAPSVGFSQPWNFVLIKDRAIRQRVKEAFENEFQNQSYY